MIKRSQLDRPAGKVLADTRRGLVSSERARRDYGVVIAADGTVDDAATSSLRQSLRSEADAAEFGHGTGRQAFETVWTPARYAALTRISSESGLKISKFDQECAALPCRRKGLGTI